jgi:A/G-specific adenine glycosylase
LIDSIPAFRSALLNWYDGNQRPLPWRTEPSVYKTVISEFMLQQTQVKTALPYFETWMQRFPDFQSLSEAPIEAVLKHWEGLGYYNRARNLHKLAYALVTSDSLPNSPEAWKALPGIGEYTANAISSIAQKHPIAVVDGNVVRVLARLSGDATCFKGNAQAVKHFTELANELLDRARPGDANQAMMELGATVCTKGQPKCQCCPLQTFCLGFQAGKPEGLPKIIRPKRTQVQENRAFIIREQSLLLYKISSDAKRLKDHYELPSLEALGLTKDSKHLKKLTDKKRGISNQVITESVYQLDIASNPIEAKEPFYWIDFKSIDHILLSGPHKRWIRDLLKLL